MAKKLKILAAGDLHGSKEISKKLSRKAKKENADLVVLAGDIFGFESPNGGILDPFVENRQKVLFVPGNWDNSEDMHLLQRTAKNIDKRYVNYQDWGILGIGSPDWKLELENSDFYNLEDNFKKMKLEKKILVSHLHAAGTKAEFSGVLGDKILRKAIEEFSPDILIASHIHEGEGIEDRIGKTRVFQVGRGGKIIEVFS